MAGSKKGSAGIHDRLLERQLHDWRRPASQSRDLATEFDDNVKILTGKGEGVLGGGSSLSSLRTARDRMMSESIG